MLAEVEIRNGVDKQTFTKAVPSCRRALIETQYEPSRSRRLGRFSSSVA